MSIRLADELFRMQSPRLSGGPGKVAPQFVSTSRWLMTSVNSNKGPRPHLENILFLFPTYFRVVQHPDHGQESNTGSFGIDLLQRRLASFFVINTSPFFSFSFFFCTHSSSLFNSPQKFLGCSALNITQAF